MIDTTEIEIEEFSIDANYFKDSEIKEIKKAFRARDVGKEMGWISFCNLVLVEKLHALEKLLDQMCHYLTTRDGLFGCNDFEYGQSYKYSLHRYFGF